MINWTKYFDKIVCLNYSDYTYRKLLLEYELKRVGILDSGIFEWHFTFQDIYYKSFHTCTKTRMSLNYFSDTKGHIDIIRKAYYEGCNRVLIVEDDVRFLRDLNKIEKMLEDIPDDKLWDIILFDKSPQCEYILYFNHIKNKKNLVSRNYYNFDNITMLSGACYCLNRTGMLKMFETFNIALFDHIIDWLWNFKSLKMRKIAPLICIAIQGIFENAENYTHALPKCNNDKKQATLFLQRRYKSQQMDLNDYMVKKDGSEWDYGRWIKLNDKLD